MNPLKHLYLLPLLLLLSSCGQPQVGSIESIKKSTQQTNVEQQMKQGVKQADALKESHSVWYDREEKLPLSIITTAYIDPEATNTIEYKAFKNLVKSIEKDPSLLGDIAEKYSSIKFVNFQTNKDAQRKFNTAYNFKYADKEKLSDILRPDVEKPSQELLIRLNYEELQKGNLTIEGYKTLKQQSDGKYNGEVWKKQENENTQPLEDKIDKLSKENKKFGQTLKVLIGHTDDVNSVAISPDGRYALSGSKDKTLRYWDLNIILINKNHPKG